MAKMRSPNYPARSLPAAVELARKFWDKEKRTSVPADVAAKAIGYSSLSGPARVALAAMRKYGLLDEDRAGYKLTDAALHILHGSADEKASALRDAALRPDLFRQIYDSHKDASPDALRSHLITKLGFSDVGAMGFVESFRDTIQFANLEKQGYSGSDETSGSESMEQPEMLAARRGSEPPIRLGTPLVSHPNPSTFVWPLSKGITAHLSFTGGAPTAAHLERLAKYLELAKIAVEAEEEQ